MAGQRGGGDIIHSLSFQVAIGNVEAGGLDQIDREAEAGGKTQDRAGIACYIRLVECQSEVGHDAPFVSSGCETPKATGILLQQGAFWPRYGQFTPLRGWKFRDFRVIDARLQSPAGRADMNILLIMRFPAVMPIKATWRR
jgi:hypothetical protein